MTVSLKTQCPLCESQDDSTHYHNDTTRDYYCCERCGLIFVPPNYFLTAEAEKSRYDLHENDPEDERYVRFLSQLFEPISSVLKPNSIGLDFGSGPGPTLHRLFENEGHQMSLYDPFYAPNTSVLDKQYDFITMSEVIEHIQSPKQVLEGLWESLNGGGYLGIMTKRPSKNFATWHYIQDDTHVCFYGDKTFQWLAKKLSAKIVFDYKTVIILQKRSLGRLRD